MRRRLRIGWVALLCFFLSGCVNETDIQPDETPSVDASESGVAADAYDVRPLFPGMPAPSFTTRDAQNVEFVFDPDARERPVILAFYRGGWCPYCNLQLAELREMDQQLADLGYELLFLSADRPAVLAEGSMGDDIPFRLLSDSTMSIASDFGIAFKVADETIERYKGAGIDLAGAAGGDHGLLPVPSVFIIGSDGEIKFQYVNPNYRERIPGSLLLGAAKAFAEEV